MGITEIQLRSFIVCRGDFGVVFASGEVVLGQSEIDKFKLFGVMIDQYVKRFNVSVHDSL